jgi:hypothetical protein
VPQVLDLSGQPVRGARVRTISFPFESVMGPNGIVNYISGSGTAEIEVSGEAYSGVLLCSQ